MQDVETHTRRGGAGRDGRQKTLPYNLVTRLWITPFLFCVRTWPLWLTHAFAWIVTSTYYPFMVRRRHDYQANLRHILGADASGWVLFRTTFRMLVNYAYYLIDLFRLDEVKRRELMSLLKSQEGYDRLTAVIDKGKGAILMTAHLGNWEVGGMLLSALGHPVNIVYFPDGSRRIEAQRTKRRMMGGVKEIRLEPGKLSPLEMMRALRAGEVVAVQGDKLYHDPGVRLDFFGSPAYFPKGPVVLAMTTGAPIVPSFVVIDSLGKYSVIVEEPIYMETTGDRDADILHNLKRVVRVLERYIGRYHDQWYMLTKFWEE